jgi:hypothetical protein
MATVYNCSKSPAVAEKAAAMGLAVSRAKIIITTKLTKANTSGLVLPP